MSRRFPRALLPALTALALAVALVPVTARSACACTGRLAGFRAVMTSDLLNLVTAQEGFHADSGRYTTIDSLIALGRYSFSSPVRLVESSLSDIGFTARVRHESLLDITCSISVGTGSTSDVVPDCTPFAIEQTHWRDAIIYCVLLAVAWAIQLRHSMVVSCASYDLDRYWLLLAAGTAGYILLNPGAAITDDSVPHRV